MEQQFGRQALRPRARLLRTLGDDLISSKKVALIELVKNAYDADASVVLVRFSGIAPHISGRIEIWDDGHGMDAAVLQRAWLDIATDVKRKRPRSESGRRRVLGEKGIGRLAAARLGSELRLVSRRASSSEVELLIDWSAFDRPDAYLDEVELAWEEGPAKVFTPSGAAAEAFSEAGVTAFSEARGTLLQIDKLAGEWAEADFAELRTSLARLMRPRPSSTGVIDEFRIILSLPAPFTSLDGEVEPPEELDMPSYRLFGSVDNNGIAQLTYIQHTPPATLELRDEPLWSSSGRKPAAGPFELDISVWDRDTEAIRAAGGGSNIRAFRRLLDDVAGVSVYRDGFRVLPFGEAGDDWLGLDRRRVQNPTLRLSNNQILGHIFISADNNDELKDQSNREGLLEGAAYSDLKSIVGEALAEIETRRYAARRPSEHHTDARRGLFESFELNGIREAIVANDGSDPADTALLSLVDNKVAEMQASVESVQRTLSQYSRLATLGSLIDRVLHDGRTAATRLASIARFGERDLAKQSLTRDEKIAVGRKAMRDTHLQADLLSTLFNQIEPFSGRKRGRPSKVGLRLIVNEAADIFASEAIELGVLLETLGDEVEATVDRAEILTVLVNLIQNALHWVTTNSSGSPGQILVGVNRNTDGSVTLTVSDNGPGVPYEIRDLIFDPYFSQRPDGVGLGLSIAGNIVEELYGGELELDPEGPLSGATFRATLRKRV
ncbi:ATP-binding protein [Agromyces sp. NPDC058064]|uniref:sensor histidine kinase n=1 Tax=Agromyces sp. NPDC058064 TaxID=3346322 RepID=UPI0036DBBD1D